jgi:hypothetical protein
VKLVQPILPRYFALCTSVREQRQPLAKLIQIHQLLGDLTWSASTKHLNKSLMIAIMTSPASGLVDFDFAFHLHCLTSP